ncbi:hypothetical protein FRC11_006311 [Ceratobasidium sp. 423]|nr:hypothetical protein FRC11_006311 [Ceratobasidium sp. 423]
MSEKVLTPEDRIKHLKDNGCTIIGHITYREGLQANDTGANPLGFYVDDGAYRIVQMTSDNTVQDAITKGISIPGAPVNVEMGSHPDNLKDIIWQIKRQYGVKNAFTIVPELATFGGGQEYELGATTAPHEDNVIVKRSPCYPIWRIEGAGMIIYKENTADGSQSYGALRFFRIFEIGTNRCWRTERNDNVGLAEAPVDQPPMNQLYELYRVGDIIDAAVTQSTNNISVCAQDATPIKKVYMSSGPIEVEDLLRNLSIQILTESRDQGWASEPEEGIWSWFELAIFTKRPADGQQVNPSDIKQHEGKPLTWTSHENKLCSDFQWIEGPKFTWDHEIWRYIEQNNYVVVLACVQYPAWQNDIRGGKFIVERVDLTRMSIK